MKQVAVLVGSLRRDSINRKFAEALGHLAAERLEFRFVELGDVPMYNEDLFHDGEPPETVARMKREIEGADAVLFVVPEYNRSFPAVLKNAIDWASRPMGSGVFVGKPLAVVGTAYGQFGGVWAQDETRKSFGIAGAKVLEDVTLAIPGSVVRFAEVHPKDDAEVVAKLAEVVSAVVASTRSDAA